MSYPNIGNRSKGKGTPLNQVSNKELLTWKDKPSSKDRRKVLAEIDKRGM